MKESNEIKKASRTMPHWTLLLPLMRFSCSQSIPPSFLPPSILLSLLLLPRGTSQAHLDGIMCKRVLFQKQEDQNESPGSLFAFSSTVGAVEAVMDEETAETQSEESPPLCRPFLPYLNTLQMKVQ